MSKTYIKEIENAQNQPFTCASFSGGGAKGAIYSGAHEALSKGGIIKTLEAVAGSSAGSITAAMIATGISTEKFQKISQETNLKGLLGDGTIINKDGKPLLELMQNTIRTNISEYLENVDVIDLCNKRLNEINDKKSNLETLSQKEQKQYIEKFEKEERILKELINSQGKDIETIRQKALDLNGKILFKDIRMLRILDPETFKDLVITATRRDSGELEIFSTENTPDVEIALACRASASIPIVFEPVTINGNQYVDGGYRDNLPLKYFDKTNQNESKDISDSPLEIQNAKKERRTLALAFGSGMDDSANVAIYSAKEKIVDPGRITKFLMDVVFKVLARVGGKFKYSQEENKLHERIRDNALNTIVLDTKELSALSFDLAQERSEYLHIKGSMQTYRYLDNHDIVKINDQNFELKEFMLKVYEESQNKTTIDSWKNKITVGKDEKLQDMLNFCKDDKWKNKDQNTLLSQFVESCAKSRPSNKLKINTTTMKNLVAVLNDPFTPSVVRENFIQLLEVDISKDKNFDKNKDFKQNLVKFNFAEDDFKNLILEKESSKNHSQDILLKSEKKQSVQNIVKQGKHSSNLDKILQEKAATSMNQNKTR